MKWWIELALLGFLILILMVLGLAFHLVDAREIQMVAIYDKYVDKWFYLDPSIAGIVSPYSSEYTEKQELNSYCNQLPNKCK